MKIATLKFTSRNRTNSFFEALIFETKNYNEFGFIIKRSVPLSTHYEKFFLDLINGSYSFTYVSQDEVKVCFFNEGNPFKNIEAYIRDFDQTALETHFSIYKIETIEDLREIVFDFSHNISERSFFEIFE